MATSVLLKLFTDGKERWSTTIDVPLRISENLFLNQNHSKPEKYILKAIKNATFCKAFSMQKAYNLHDIGSSGDKEIFDKHI